MASLDNLWIMWIMLIIYLEVKGRNIDTHKKPMVQLGKQNIRGYTMNKKTNWDSIGKFLERSNMSTTERALYMILLGFAENQNKSYFQATNRDLCFYLGASESTLRRTVKKLEEKGAIKKEFSFAANGKNESNIYYVAKIKDNGRLAAFKVGDK